MRWMLFRALLGAGLAKLRAGDCWLTLSCGKNWIEAAQPLPTPVSWYMANLPVGFQYALVAVILFSEVILLSFLRALIVPLSFPPPLRLISCLLPFLAALFFVHSH